MRQDRQGDAILAQMTYTQVGQNSVFGDGLCRLFTPNRALYRATIRMAILLLTVESLKNESLEGLCLSVWADANGTGYSIHDREGNLVESSGDWTSLLHRLEMALPESKDALFLICP